MSHRTLDPALSTECRPYHSHDALQPLVPGEVYRADVEIWPTSLVIPAGYRIALTIRGRDHERRYARALRLGSFKNEMTGCGPFPYEDPVDRPPRLTGSTRTLWVGPRPAAAPAPPGRPARRPATWQPADAPAAPDRAAPPWQPVRARPHRNGDTDVTAEPGEHIVR